MDPNEVSAVACGSTRQRADKAPRIDDEDWEKHRNTIRELYIEKNLRAEDVCSRMEENHGFKATVAQYRIQLRKWNMRKNKNRNGKRPRSPSPDQDNGGPSRTRHRSSQAQPQITPGSQQVANNRPAMAPDWMYNLGPDHLFPPDPIGLDYQQDPIPAQYSFDDNLAMPPYLYATAPRQSFTPFSAGGMGGQYGAGIPPQENPTYANKRHVPENTNINIRGESHSTPPIQYGSRSSTVRPAQRKRQSIHQAVQAGSYRAVQLLLEADPACARLLTGEGLTTVWIAAQQGHPAILRLLLEHGVNANIPETENQRLPIHQAAQSGCQPAVELLLEAGVQHDPKDSGSVTPLLITAQQGHYGIVKILLDKKADMEVQSINGGRKAIHQAAQGGHLSVVKLLLDYGAHSDPLDNQGITPLWSAAQEGHVETVRELLEADAKIDVSSYDGSRQPIHQAAQNGHLEVARLLLENGADAKPEANAFNDTIPSPFWLAAQSGNVELVKLLLERGAGMDFSVGTSGKTTLHASSHKGHIAMARFLIDKGCNIDAKESDGWTPLMIACQEGYLELATLLVEKKADINAAEKDGATCLWIAAQQGHAAIVQMLLQNDAKQLATKSAKRYPIHQAAQNGHPACVRLLLEDCPEHIDAEDKNGGTPLLLASQESKPHHLAIMKYLVSMGAKVTVE